MEPKEQIKIWADAYYNGKPIVSDEEYDAFCEAINVAGGLQGNELAGVIELYDIPQTMGTLAKTNSEEEFKKWWSSHPNKDIVVEDKIDGCSMLLEYKKGKLSFAYSRGDGYKGMDYTSKALLMKGVPKEIETSFTVHIRGEVVMRKSIFEKKYLDSGYKNPRNMCSGLMKRLDNKGIEDLEFIAYDLWGTDSDKTESDKMSFLNKNKFTIPRLIINPTFEDILKIRNDLITDGEIPVDGIVIKQNKVSQDDLKRHTPLNNVAFKPELQMKVSTIIDIEWQLAGEQLSPVAIIEPIELEGTTVSRASLSNVNIMNELGIYKGAKVYVEKRGMIIPKIIKVVEPKSDAFDIPTICPICGGKVVVNESGIPVCINNLCPRKVSHRFTKIFDILGIKGTGDAFISYMEEHGITVSDFFEIIARKDEETLNRFAGSINGGKILKQMINVLSKPISTAKFLALFDYKGFDEKKLKLIGKPLDEMYNLTFNDLIKIDGFAEKTANLFLSFMHDCKEEIEDIKHYFIIEDAVVSSGKLNGLSFCFTGAACKPRKELQMLVEENGGIVKSGVAKGLNYLVSDDKDSGSSKMVKAKSLGITLINSSEFLEMICQ